MSLFQRGSAKPCPNNIARGIRCFRRRRYGDQGHSRFVLRPGAEMLTSMRIANLAAGLSVEKFGTATITAEELLVADQARRVQSAEAKIMPLQHLLEKIQRWRARGERIGFTNGCFDLVHPGHVTTLSVRRANATV